MQWCPENTAYTASISAIYVIAAALSVTVSTDKSIYTRNQTVSMTAYVSCGGAPVANAGVTFTVTEANGLVVGGKSTTGASGVASQKFRLKRQDPPAVYQVRADVTNAGLTGSATTSFEVQ